MKESICCLLLEVVYESLDFNPFELVLGTLYVNNCKLYRGRLEDRKTCNLFDYVSEFKYRLYKAHDLAHGNVKVTV